jgi:tRNA(adenine34) deaminase
MEAKPPEYFMLEALKLADNALKHGEFPIAAIVVLDDEIIGKSATAEQSQKRFLVHAELLALEEADKLGLSTEKRRQARLFTNLEPCLMCIGAAMSFFLGEIYYSLESPGDGAVNLVEAWNRKKEDMPGYRAPKITGGLLRGESIALFKKYVSVCPPGPMRYWASTLTKL